MSVRVLVVDDERTIADALAAILRNHSYQSRAAYTALQAMDEAEAFQPQFLIADIVMPEMSGIDLAEWFTETHPECRILLTSANLMHFDSSYLQFSNADKVAFLPKPMRISEVLQFLHTSAPVP